MSNTSYEDLQAEMRDLEKLLHNVQRETRSLLSKGGDSQKKPKIQKPEEAQSSWARSKVPSTASVSGKRHASCELEGREVLDVDKRLHTRAPSFTIGVKHGESNSKRKSDEIVAAEPNPLTYRVQDKQLSTKKRSHTVTFGRAERHSAARQSTADATRRHSDATAIERGPESSSPEDFIIVEYEEVIPTGYSFGKSKRFAAAKDDQDSYHDANGSDPLHVEKARTVLYPHTPSVVYAKPHQKSKRVVEKENSAREAMDVSDDHVDTANLDVLAYRPRIAAAVIRPPTPSTTKSKLSQVDKALTPGPGHYDIDETALGFTKRGQGVTTGHRISTGIRSESRLNRYLRSDIETAEVGPGSYNPEPVRHHVPAAQYRSEPKDLLESNPKLARKRYFEQKAADLRDFHDDMRSADDSVLRSRTSTVVPWRSDRHHSLTPDKRSRVRQAQAAHHTEAPSQLAYDVKYDVVERRSNTAVSMRSEVQARLSTQNRLVNKEQVRVVLADKAEGDTAANRFYGPALPVAWVKDKESMQQKKGLSSPERAESPTAEILRMLSARQQGGTSSNTADLHDPYTEAFLQSSYAGSMHQKKPLVLMETQNSQQDRFLGHRKLTAEEQEFDYLGPQLQPDWTDAEGLVYSSHGTVKRFKSPAVRLDKTTSRNKVKVHGKGLVEVDEFGSHVVHKATDVVGPGEYDTMAQVEMARAKAKGVIKFEKIVAREDAVGPRGEKPESSLAAERELQDDPELGGQQLDIDYAEAKDAYRNMGRPQGIVLYMKDRYPEEKKPSDKPQLDHLGGSWFEGMYDTIAKKKNQHAIDFDKMKGRSIMEQNEDLDADMEAEFGPQVGGAVLDLEVTDWQPHKAALPGKTLVEFADAKKYPRFQQDRATREKAARYANQTTLEPHPEYLWSKKDGVALEMDKMQGREDLARSVEDIAAVEALVHGEIDAAGAIELGEARAQAVRQGQDATKKRPKAGVDFSKQRGRDEVNRANDGAEHAMVEEAADNQGQLFVDAPVRVYESTLATKGQVPWDLLAKKQSDKQEETKAWNDMVRGDIGQGQEELDLDPTRDGTSKHRRIKGGVAWEKQEDTGRKDHDADAALLGAENSQMHTLLEQERGGRLLDLDDVDPGFFKAGMHGIAGKESSKKYPGVTMANRPGRVAEQATAKQVLSQAVQDELGIEIPHDSRHEGDKVDIAPTDKPLQRHTRASTAMKSQSARFGTTDTAATGGGRTIGKGTGANLAQEIDEFGETESQPRKLQLSPRDTATRTRLKTLPTMQSSQARLPSTAATETAAADKVFTKIGLQPALSPGAELDLQVKDDILRRSNPALGTSSLRNSTARFPQRQEDIVLEETANELGYLHPDVGRDVLKIDPQDNATRFRTPGSGAALSKAATGRGSSTKVKSIASSTVKDPHSDVSERSISGKVAVQKPVATTQSIKSYGKKTSAATKNPESSTRRARSGSTKETAASSIAGKGLGENKSTKKIAPSTVSPPAVGAPTPLGRPMQQSSGLKEFFDIEEEMRKLGL